MDEPTSGLDPQSRVALRELTKQLNRSGITIFYTTHDMEEADKLCDRIAIMDRGNIIALGTSDEIKHMIKDEKTVEIEIEGVSSQIIAELKKLPYVSSLQHNGRLIHINTKNTNDIFFKLSDFLLKRNQKVIEIRVKEHSLEEIFIHLTKKDLRDLGQWKKN